MFRVTDIDHIVLRTSNAESLLRFYVDVLGCPIERDRRDIGLIQLRAGRALIDIVPVDSELGKMGGRAPGHEGKNLDHFCLTVEPFEADAVVGYLNQHGIDCGAPSRRYGARGFGPSVYIQDPDGNTVELKGQDGEPLDGAG